MAPLNKNEFLNSNNFLNFSDTFYGAYIQHEDLHKFDKNNYRVLLDENGSCLIKNKSFKKFNCPNSKLLPTIEK